jgi:hypothetical protein
MNQAVVDDDNVDAIESVRDKVKELEMLTT